MPILTTTESAEKRRTLSWLIVPIGVALVAVFVWSWFRRLDIPVKGGNLYIGFSLGDLAPTGFRTYGAGAHGVKELAVRLPDDSGAYLVSYVW